MSIIFEALQKTQQNRGNKVVAHPQAMRIRKIKKSEIGLMAVIGLLLILVIMAYLPRANPVPVQTAAKKQPVQPQVALKQAAPVVRQPVVVQQPTAPVVVAPAPAPVAAPVAVTPAPATMQQAMTPVAAPAVAPVAAPVEVSANAPVLPMLSNPDTKGRLILNGVFISDIDKIAMINNKSYHIGDSIEGMKIVSIEPESVKLRGDKLVFEIRTS